MNVKKLASKREKARKRLGRDQMVFFTECSLSFYSSFLPNQFGGIWQHYFWQQGVSSAVSYHGSHILWHFIGSVLSHSILSHFIRYGVIVWHFTGGMRSHYSSLLHTLFSMFLLTFPWDLEWGFRKCCWNMLPICNNHQFFQLKQHWMHSKWE